jgi:ABC-type sugar transport system substrate-binding protein
MKTSKIISGLLAGLAMMAAASTMAASIDVNIGMPGFVEPRPVYVQPQYENDWRERRVRANQWRAEDRHDHDDDDHKSHKKHKKNKHNKHNHKHH